MRKVVTVCWECQKILKESFDLKKVDGMITDKRCDVCGKKKGEYALDVVLITNKKGEQS